MNVVVIKSRLRVRGISRVASFPLVLLSQRALPLDAGVVAGVGGKSPA